MSRQSWSARAGKVAPNVATAPPARRTRQAVTRRLLVIGDSQTDRGAHELYAVFACPIGRAGHAADLAAGRIDDQSGRHAESLAGRFQVLEHFGAVVRIIAKVLDPDPFEEGERLF